MLRNLRILGSAMFYAVLATILCAIYINLPIESMPLHWFDDYQAFQSGMQGWPQQYLIPSSDLIQTEFSGGVIVINTRRDSYEPEAYQVNARLVDGGRMIVTGIPDGMDDGLGLFSLTPDRESEYADQYKTATVGGMEVQIIEDEEYQLMRLEWEGVIYRIGIWDTESVTLQNVAEDLLRHGTKTADLFPRPDVAATQTVLLIPVAILFALAGALLQAILNQFLKTKWYRGPVSVLACIAALVLWGVLLKPWATRAIRAVWYGWLVTPLGFLFFGMVIALAVIQIREPSEEYIYARA